MARAGTELNCPSYPVDPASDPILYAMPTNRRSRLRTVENHLLGPRRERPAARRPAQRVAKEDGEQPSALERSLGPGCLISLVIVVLMVVAFKRLLHMPAPVLVLVALAVFVVVMLVLLRMRPVRIDRS